MIEYIPAFRGNRTRQVIAGALLGEDLGDQLLYHEGIESERSDVQPLTFV